MRTILSILGLSVSAYVGGIAVADRGECAEPRADRTQLVPTNDGTKSRVEPSPPPASPWRAYSPADSLPAWRDADAPRDSGAVFRGPHLVVRIAEEVGHEWSRGLLRVATEETLAAGDPELAEDTLVCVAPCSPGSERAVVTGAMLEGIWLDHDSVGVEVQAGRRYLVSVLGLGFDPRPQIVSVPAHGGRVEVVALAGARAFPGGVRARLELPPGVPGGRNVWLRLEDPVSGMLVASAPWTAGPEFELRAPPGRYRLVARGRPYVDEPRGALVRRRALGRAEMLVDVLPGDRVDALLQLGGGALVELELCGAPDESDRAAARRYLGPAERADEIARFEAWASSATVALLAPTGAWEALERERLGLEREAGEPTLGDDWLLGERALSEVASPGRWTIVASLPGGREARAEVELRAGETAQVRLEFAIREL